MIYRVTVKSTNSLQPMSGTYWCQKVAYCGTDLEEARTEYLRQRPEDHGASYGNRSRETVIEAFESEPDEIDSEELAEMDVAE